MIHSALIDKGIKANLQIKSYREDDLFDFKVRQDGKVSKLDVKTVTYLSDYKSMGRDNLTPELIINNKGYPGPDWRHFFPILIPHTQINQGKEMYCFAIGKTTIYKGNIDNDRSDYLITAFPYGEVVPFFCSKKLCLEREAAGQGIYLTIQYHSYSLLNGKGFNLEIVGEWNGQPKQCVINVKKDAPEINIGPFSCVSAFHMSRDEYENLYGVLEIEVSKNDLHIEVFNSNMQDVNDVPTEPLKLTKDDFCNLILPDNYTLFVLGWISKDEFLEKCRQYPAWVWPNDKLNKYENQRWSQV